MFLFLSTHKPLLLYLHFSLVTQKIADFVEKLLKLPHLLWQVWGQHSGNKKKNGVKSVYTINGLIQLDTHKNLNWISCGLEI